MPERLRAGLIGSGIALSRTPRMHMEEGKAAGLDYRYDLVDTEGDDTPLSDHLDRAEAAGFAGVNITHPFKQAVLEHVDDVSASVAAIGASNTVVFRGGTRIAHNTDAWGFAEGFRRSLRDAKVSRVLLVGAGGAGLAVAHALMDCGVGQLLVFDAEEGAAKSLCRSVSAAWGADRVSVAGSVAAAMEVAEGVVNATPVGMAAYPGSAVPLAALCPSHWVADIIYFPLETELIRASRKLGCRVMSGADMAIFQAVRAFELFTGIAADPARMRASFEGFDRAN